VCAAETKVGSSAALWSSRAITEVSGVVVLYSVFYQQRQSVKRKAKRTHAKANVRALYFDHEMLLGGSSSPSQPAYHPVATTSVRLPEVDDELLAVGTVTGVTSATDFADVRLQEPPVLVAGAAKTRLGRKVEKRAASSIIDPVGEEDEGCIDSNNRREKRP
jgi:hypothetical protein